MARRSNHLLNTVPYLIHTNRELGLMLKGAKPLAKFSDVKERFPDAVLRYLRMFDRHVEAGRILRRDEFVEDKQFGLLHYVYFALPGEEWRIEAMHKLMTGPGRWTRAHEREEGELLGYTPEQIEIWLEQFYAGRD